MSIKYTMLAGAAIAMGLSAAAVAETVKAIPSTTPVPASKMENVVSPVAASPIISGTPDGMPSSVPAPGKTAPETAVATSPVTNPVKTAAVAPLLPVDIFMTIPALDDLSSQVVGLELYNAAHDDLGTIKDIAFDKTGVQAYIVGLGGFLGMGDHYVAVRPSAISLNYNSSERKWHAEIDVTIDQLKAAPAYIYNSNS